MVHNFAARFLRSDTFRKTQALSEADTAHSDTGWQLGNRSLSQPWVLDAEVTRLVDVSRNMSR